MQPGEIFALPPEDLFGGDPKQGRPHILVSIPSADGEIATLVYCSTKGWEIPLSAPPHVIIEPTGTAFATTGLRERTFAYPARLTMCFVSELDEKCGVLLDELPLLQSELLRAIGFRTGVSKSSGQRASGSWRGAVVRFTAEYSQAIGFEIGLVVTEPTYSKQRVFQTFVPLVLVDELTPGATGTSLTVQNLIGSNTEAVAITRGVQSCNHRFAIHQVVGHISAGDMKQVEDQLAVRFFGSVLAAETCSY